MFCVDYKKDMCTLVARCQGDGVLRATGITFSFDTKFFTGRFRITVIVHLIVIIGDKWTFE